MAIETASSTSSDNTVGGAKARTSANRADVINAMPWGHDGPATADTTTEIEGAATDASAVKAAKDAAPEVAKPSADELKADAEPKVDDQDDDEDDLDAAPKVDTKGDPDAEKRLSALQKQEKRLRDQAQRRASELDEREKALAKREADIAKVSEQAQRIEKLKARAKYAPDAVLGELGLSEDEYEDAAKLLYARSKAGAADPKNKENARAFAEAREAQDRIAKLEARIEEMTGSMKEREESAARERMVGEYLDTVSKSVSAEAAPLVARMLEKNPAKTRQQFHQMASYLASRDGETPDAEDVIAELEKHRRAELEEMGVDVSAFAKSKPKTDASKPGRTIDTQAASTTTQPKTSKKTRTDLLREMPWGSD